MSTNLEAITDLTAEENELLTAQIKNFVGEISLHIPENIDEVFDMAVYYERAGVEAFAKQGALLLHGKTQVSHGEFKNYIAKRDMHYDSAKRAMAIAKMLMQLPKSKRATFTLLNMNKSQLAELARLPAESIDSLDDEELEALGDMPVRELRKELRKYKEKATEFEESNVGLINALENERLSKAPSQMYQLPVLVAKVRRDAFAHSAAVNESLEQFITLTEALCNARDLDLNHRIGAAQTSWHLWLGVQQRINHMLNRLSGEFGPEHLVGAECIPQFAQDEWQDAQANREYMLAMFTDTIKHRK